ncbi:MULTISPECIES: hypothetical protein [Rhodonellum]|nr:MULTISPECIES: hypothetical protein [Rhodonellum]SDY95617.1 hypothetical protein SAMN05444412_10443 [Rhodonellum ikkaensis]
MTLKNLINGRNEVFWKFLPVIVVMFFSCQAKDRESASLDIDLVKVDSFVVKRDTRFRILDHHSKNGNYLGYDPITKSFILIDAQGEIIREVLRIGEGPNEYNSNLSSAAFNEDGGGVFLQSSNELIWYDQNWEIKKRWKYGPNFGLTVYGGPRYRTPYYFGEDTSRPFVFTSFFPNTKIPFNEIQTKLGNGHIVELFDSSNDTLIWKLPIDFSLYSEYNPKDKEFDLAPIYYLDTENKLLLLSFDNSIAIGVYDLNADFNFTRQINLEKSNLMDNGKGKTVKLFPVYNRDLMILRYSGMSELELATKKEANSTYSPIQDSKLYRFYYASEDKNVLKELPFPEGIEPNSELIILASGKFLMRDKDEEGAEMNYSSYSIYELRM